MIGRNKKGQFIKGHPNFHRKYTYRKISKNNARYWLGKKRISPSISTRRKLRKAFLGKKRPISIVCKIRKSALKGRKHWNWKGGITPVREKIWARIEYKEWRDKIFKRDDYRCQLCKKRSGFLQADHYPVSFSKILKENKIKTVDKARKCKKLWNIKNGRTLCLLCHRKTKTWGKG